jgi:RimJ/RimL family protein N-acetyltransferase
MSSPWPELFTADGQYVCVEPLRMDHESDLKEAAADGDLHLLWYTTIPKAEDMAEEIERRLSLRKTGSMLPFAIIDKASGQAVGMTTYMNIDAQNKRLEIGSTWYRKSAQRGPLNTECKLLLLQHAFEELDCMAVEFRTHFVNIQSRRAIERLGAKLDGVLRSHLLMDNGTVRDTAVYSIIANEWPTVKAHLTWQLEKPRD